MQTVRIRTFGFVLLGLLGSSVAYAHGISEADQEAMLGGGYMQFVELGAGHMLTGYDHLLFLFGVVFFLSRFKDIIKFITAFTIGHSITLITATFLTVSVNYFLIDAVIALTVCYKGFDNIDGFKKVLNTQSPSLVGMVFAFGLIHGFGLSTRLQQLPLGDDGLLMKIISFNVGVELGQVAALAVMLVILNVWRRSASFERFSFASNVGLIVAGALLCLMQLHGLSHDAFVDDLAFSSDSHFHAHEELGVADHHRQHEALEASYRRYRQGFERQTERDEPADSQPPDEREEPDTRAESDTQAELERLRRLEQVLILQERMRRQRQGGGVHSHGGGEPHSH